MANFVRFDRTDIQAIIGLIDEIDPEDRTEQEEIVYNKAQEIAALQASTQDRPQPELFIDPSTGRLTIQYGENVSEPVGYKGIAMIGNLFAVTEYYKDYFPTNVLLRFFHANPKERIEWDRATGESNNPKKAKSA